MGQNIKDFQHWILQNLYLFCKAFGKSNVVLNTKTWRSILINRFALPYNWRPSYSRLLIILPKGSRIFYNPPDRFYLDKGLRAINGKTPGHYFENAGFNDMAQYNIARFSFHVKQGWNPKIDAENGTNLLHVIKGLKIGLNDAAQGVL